MKKTVLQMILILILPALCLGSAGPGANLEVPGVEWAAFRLDLASPLTADTPALRRLALPRVEESRAPGYSSPINDPENARIAAGYGPDNMVSMVSFVWAELTGGVDLVAEVREFSRQWKMRGRSVQAAAGKEPDSRCWWKIVVACRVDDNLELAARFDTRGSLFNEKNVAFELSAADVFPDEVGITTVYRDRTIMIEADKVAMNGTAMAKVVVRF
ncbi:MAG: hypothetical protein RRA32_10430 [bacterium]|nr:hypothetical protein [bacterium]